MTNDELQEALDTLRSFSRFTTDDEKRAIVKWSDQESIDLAWINEAARHSIALLNILVLERAEAAPDAPAVLRLGGVAKQLTGEDYAAGKRLVNEFKQRPLTADELLTVAELTLRGENRASHDADESLLDLLTRKQDRLNPKERGWVANWKIDLDRYGSLTRAQRMYAEKLKKKT